MQIIGFNFTKISANRQKELNNFSINTNIEFIDLQKEKIELMKDNETAKLDFKFTINYHNAEDKDKKNPHSQAEIIFEGNIVLMFSDEESKEVYKSWKKKELPPQFRLFLFNFILKKCSTKALSLEDELNLPVHIPMPQLKPQQQQQ